MSYPERRNIVNIIVMVLIIVSYLVYIIPRYEEINGLQRWAVTMLVFMGITAGVMIIVQVIFHVLYAVGIAVKEAVVNQNMDESSIEQNVKGEMVEDERDKLFALKSSRVSTIITGVAFMSGLILLAVNQSPVLMLNILFCGIFLSSIVESVINLVYYRKGFANG